MLRWVLLVGWVVWFGGGRHLWPDEYERAGRLAGTTRCAGRPTHARRTHTLSLGFSLRPSGTSSGSSPPSRPLSNCTLKRFSTESPLTQWRDSSKLAGKREDRAIFARLHPHRPELACIEHADGRRLPASTGCGGRGTAPQRGPASAPSGAASPGRLPPAAELAPLVADSDGCPNHATAAASA